METPLGRDVDAQTLAKLERLSTPAGAPADPVEAAQLRELAFWRWVAFEGYDGGGPQDFPAFQRRLMLGCYSQTGWSIDRFRDRRAFEFGCGPLGMIEFLPCRERFAYDPLNPHYALLFEKVRSPSISYLSASREIASIGAVDLGICFNVLDHTPDAWGSFEMFFATIRSGGAFILQVNTVRDGYARSSEHASMHPSPLAAETVLAWVRGKSDDVQFTLADQPSADNEFFLQTWGTRTGART